MSYDNYQSLLFAAMFINCIVIKYLYLFLRAIAKRTIDLSLTFTRVSLELKNTTYRVPSTKFLSEENYI